MIVKESNDVTSFISLYKHAPFSIVHLNHQTGLNKSFRPIKRVRVNEIPEYGEAHGAVCSVERKIEIDRQLIWWESEIKGINLY